MLNADGADGTVVADAVRIVREVATGTVAWLHTDHLATPQKMTDAAAAVGAILLTFRVE